MTLSELDAAQQTARRLQRALRGIADRRFIEQTLAGKSEAERRAIAGAYKALTGRELRVALQSLLGRFREKATALLDRGELTDVETLRYAASGLRPDGPAIARVLKSKSPDELRALERLYLARYGEALKLPGGGRSSG